MNYNLITILKSNFKTNNLFSKLLEKNYKSIKVNVLRIKKLGEIIKTKGII